MLLPVLVGLGPTLGKWFIMDAGWLALPLKAKITQLNDILDLILVLEPQGSVVAKLSFVPV